MVIVLGDAWRFNYREVNNISRAEVSKSIIKGSILKCDQGIKIIASREN
jgi:hypothetical protein